MCTARCSVLMKLDFTRFGLRTVANYHVVNSISTLSRYTNVRVLPCHIESWSRRERRYTTDTAIPSDEDKAISEVGVTYIQGLPHLTVPLPSRNEKCRFALKPVSHNVGDLLMMLRLEDRGIDRAAVLNNEGVRIASTCSIESLMDEPFWLHINDKKYKVNPPQRERLTSEELTKLGDVRALVGQLYEALHVGEHHIKKEKEILEQLEDLRYQLSPLEQTKNDLNAKAIRRTNIMTWVGLGLMSVQFGILARLTWWEYSWDIMEPVTYFVTYGTAMAAYAYFCITKQEYNYPDVRDRQYLITIHKRAKKDGFDLNTYNMLRRKIADLEYDLRRLKDPLNVQLPPAGDPTLLSNTSTSLDTNLSSYINSSKLQLNKILNVAAKKLKK